MDRDGGRKLEARGSSMTTSTHFVLQVRSPVRPNSETLRGLLLLVRDRGRGLPMSTGGPSKLAPTPR